MKLRYSQVNPEMVEKLKSLRDVAVNNDDVPGQDMGMGGLARGLAEIMNDALSRYIETHNQVFKVSAKRLVPIPGVFEAIDFKVHVETLAGVADTLTRAGVTIASALEESSDPKVRQFLEHLQEYGAALLETVRQFRQVCDKLYRKGQDPTGYKWHTYQKDLDTYGDAIKHYYELGAKLNAAYEQLSKDATETTIRDDMNKQEILREISELIDGQEKAIHRQSPESYSVYEKCRDALIEDYNMETTNKEEFAQLVSLSFDDLLLVQRYILSSSFISAWYHLHGDKAEWDKVAQSCAMSIASLLGFDPVNALREVMRHERDWRATMKSEGIAPRRGKGGKSAFSEIMSKSGVARELEDARVREAFPVVRRPLLFLLNILGVVFVALYYVGKGLSLVIACIFLAVFFIIVRSHLKGEWFWKWGSLVDSVLGVLWLLLIVVAFFSHGWKMTLFYLLGSVVLALSSERIIRKLYC